MGMGVGSRPSPEDSMTPQLSAMLFPGKLRLRSEETGIQCMLQKKQNRMDSWVPDHPELWLPSNFQLRPVWSCPSFHRVLKP